MATDEAAIRANTKGKLAAIRMHPGQSPITYYFQQAGFLRDDLKRTRQLVTQRRFKSIIIPRITKEYDKDVRFAPHLGVTFVLAHIGENEAPPFSEQQPVALQDERGYSSTVTTVPSLSTAMATAMRTMARVGKMWQPTKTPAGTAANRVAGAARKDRRWCDGGGGQTWVSLPDQVTVTPLLYPHRRGLPQTESNPPEDWKWSLHIADRVGAHSNTNFDSGFIWLDGGLSSVLPILREHHDHAGGTTANQRLLLHGVF